MKADPATPPGWNRSLDDLFEKLGGFHCSISTSVPVASFRLVAVER